MNLIWCLVVGIVGASALAGYRWHVARRVAPLDPFWTRPPTTGPRGPAGDSGAARG